MWHCCIIEVTLLLISFEILSTIKMKFGQILVYLKTNISNVFWLNAGDWKLLPDPFLILMK